MPTTTLIGESFSDHSQLAAFKIYGDSGAPPVWTSTGTTGTPMAAGLLGAIAVRCNPGYYIFIADSGGHVRWNTEANTIAAALNGAGDVCGYTASTSPIIWPDGANSTTIYSTLSTPGFTYGEARAINSSSTIIGYAYTGATVHAFRWTKIGSTWPLQTTEDLNAPAGGQAYAYSITDDGRIAGKAMFTSGGPLHAFNTGANPFDLASEATDLGTMGGTASEAWDMHELSGTVGRSQILSGYWRGFFLPIACTTFGGLTTYKIPELPGVTRTDYSSAAYGLNMSGQVVGYTQDQTLANRAFVYSPQTGVITDLNNFTLDGGQTPAGLGWTLTRAQAINDAGVIVGVGSISGRVTCWIIYPKCQD